MEQREVQDIYDYLREGERPSKFSGRKKKNAFKAWKRKVGKLELTEKDKKRPLSLENSLFLTVRRGEIKIVARERDLETLWKKFHEDGTTGGHQGLHSMINQIQRGYFVKNL